MMRKIVALAAAVVIGLLPLYGCGDSVELNELTFAVGLGLDRNSDGGYSYTFQMAAPVGADDAVSENHMSYESLGFSAESMAMAVRQLELSVSGDVSFEHLSCLMIGESALDSDFTGALNYLFRETSVRRQCAVCVVDGSARDVLKAQYDGNISAAAAELLERMDDSRSRSGIMTLGRLSTSKADSSSFSIYSLKRSDTASAVSPADAPTEGILELSGLAVFDDGRFTGRLNAEEAELARLFVNDQTSGIITSADDDGNEYYFAITGSVCSKRVYPLGGGFAFSIDFQIDCELIDTRDAPTATALSDEKLSDALRSDLYDIVNKSRQLGNSVTGIETEARQSHLYWYNSLSSSFSELYRAAPCELTVKCTVERGSYLG